MRMLLFAGIASKSCGDLEIYKEFILNVSKEAGESTSAESKRELDSDCEILPKEK
jgi:hypothetical protein